MISKSKTIAQQRIIMFDRNMRFFNDMSSPRLYFLYFYHSADICRCTGTIRHRLLYFTVPEIWRRLFAHILQNDNDCSRHHRTWHNVIGTISNSDGSNANARNVPAAIVTQINTRSILHGKQLFTTAAIEIKISSRYMTVRHCTAENGANKLVIIIITVTAMPKGAAWERAVGRNFPRIRRMSDSKIVKKDG